MRFGLEVPPHERKPVVWYAPAVLWAAARRLLAAEQFAHHLDRRETFPRQLAVVDLSADAAPASDFWFDFVSDTGDGGDATVAVAQALFAPEVCGLPQGRLLVLGGDLAYPGCDRQDYQYRFIEPLEQALHWARARLPWRHDPRSERLDQPLAADEKLCLAIPQNHDWAVSASAFCRYFVNHDRGAVGGMRTPQKQTYFAAKLPRGWWVLGLDFALEGDIDRQQFQAFEALLTDGRIARGDRVLLLYPEPYWTRPLGDAAPEGYPKRYQRLEALLTEAGAPIRLRLAGDLHHVVHDQVREPGGGFTHLLVAGHGGAFTHLTHTARSRWPKRLDARLGGTHELAHQVTVGLAEPRERGDWQPGLRYPDEATSRRLGRRAWAAAWRARGGLLHSNLSFVLGLSALVAAALALSPLVLPVWAWAALPPALGVLLGGGLALASALHLGIDAVSSLVADTGHKGFLRFCLQADGRLQVHVMGLDAPPAQHHAPQPGEPLSAGWRVVETIAIP